MTNRFLLFTVSLVLCAGVPGCQQDENGTAPPPSPISNPLPTVTVENGFEFDEKEPWTELTQELVEDAGRSAARIALATKSQVSVVFLGERIRIYNIGGKWRPLTLTLLDDQMNPLQSFRIDLPASGVVRTNLSRLSTGDVSQLRFTQPTVKSNKKGEPFVLMDRQIGTATAEFTAGSVAELGFASIEGRTADDEAVAAFMSAHAQRKIDMDALQTIREADDASRVTATRTKSGVTSSSCVNPTVDWKSIVIADKLSSFASSNGRNGKPPTETWWAATLGDVLTQMSKAVPAED